MKNALLKQGFVLGLALIALAGMTNAAGANFYVVKPVGAQRGVSAGPVDPEISLLAGPLPAAKRGKPYAFDFKGNTRVKGGPGIGALQYLMYDGVLPQGLSLTNSGRLEGIPTAVTAPMSVDFSVRGSYVSASAEQSFSIRVDESYLQATKLVIGLQSGRIMSHACAITPSGVAKCWGRAYEGSLGDGSTGVLAPAPVTVAGTLSTMIAPGQAHTCSLNPSGGAECWGTGGQGALGNGAYASSSSPVLVSGLSAGVSRIASGGQMSCAVTAVGRAMCWGTGQLGNGATTVSAVPVEVAGLSSGVAQISVGAAHSCVVTVAGAARCFGSNNYGQLGDGSTNDSATPVNVVGLGAGVASISVGIVRTCAVTTAGAAKCWGDGTAGSLGNGSSAHSSLPVDVQGLGSGVRQISTGAAHTCAVTTSGRAMCWGANGGGILGDGTTTNSFVPVNVHGLVSGVASISAGSFNSCAVTVQGEAWCWGSGALGNGSSSSSTVPVRVLD